MTSAKIYYEAGWRLSEIWMHYRRFNILSNEGAAVRKLFLSVLWKT